MRIALALAMVAIGGLPAACGPAGSAPPAPTGAAVFARNCSACHSVIGNNSLRRQGGDLLTYRWSREALLQFAREMPVRRPLNHAQLSAVVDYILALERGPPERGR